MPRPNRPSNRHRKPKTKAKPTKRLPDPDGLARQIRRRRAITLALVVLVIAGIAFVDRGAGLLPVRDDWHRYHGQSFEVVRVIDGDTIEVRAPDGNRKITRVRLWGVDTPEMANPSRNKAAERWSGEARDFTHERTADRSVVLHLQRHRLRGRYGRLLAYVELPDGHDLGAQLIEQGLSKHDARWGHDRVEAYAALETTARREKRRIWSKK